MKDLAILRWCLFVMIVVLAMLFIVARAPDAKVIITLLIALVVKP